MICSAGCAIELQSTGVSEHDTSIGAGQSAFAQTQWSKIVAAADPAVMAELASAYWRPVYKFIRIAWRKTNEEAKDLTQEFFAGVFRPEFLARADPSRGSFRTFVLASLKNFLRDRRKFSGGLKRGGGAIVVPIDEDLAVVDGADPEKEFTRSWAEGLLAEALAELERDLSSRGRERVYQAFKAHCEGDLSYRALAERMSLSVSDVTNYLFEARRELRRILEAKVARYSGEVQEELRALFGS